MGTRDWGFGSRGSGRGTGTRDGDWGLGIGDWGLGTRDSGLGIRGVGIRIGGAAGSATDRGSRGGTRTQSPAWQAVLWTLAETLRSVRQFAPTGIFRPP